MAKQTNLSQEDIKVKVEYLFAHRLNKTLHAYIDITGDLIAGTLLSQILYWFSDGKNGNPRVSVYRDGYYWLAKRREDWMKEIRISKKQYDCAIKKLTAEIEPTEEEKKKNSGNKGKRREKKFDESKALVVVKTFHFRGVPVTHIRPVTENINRMVDEWKNALAEEIARENNNACSPNSPNGNLTNSPNGNMEIPKEENCYNIYNNIIDTDTENTNREYSTENTVNYTSKDVKRPSFEDNMYTFVPEEQEGHTQKPSRYIPPDYTEEQLREHIRPTIEENYEKIEQEYDVAHKPDGKKLIENITVEFFRQYEKKYGAKHRILPDKSYINVLERFISSRDDILDGFEIDEYRIMIEHYFNTNFDKRGNYGKKITLSLSHFMSYKILKYLVNREGILWERSEDEE